MFRILFKRLKDLFDQNDFIEEIKKESNLRSRVNMQIFTSIAFLILSITNIFSKSFVMLVFTLSGCIINTLFAVIAKKKRNSRFTSISSIVTCSILFCFFVIYGGNEGFSCLWIALIPLLAMTVMDLKVGMFTGIFLQIFLIVVFWTPINDMLLYQYGEQFCLRFPLFYLVSFILGLLFAISLKKSEYNECKRLIDLEELTNTAQSLARTDPLTRLSNRRYVYEKFEKEYGEEDKPHCIVIGDIDSFKKINDTYGHEFGDEVLVIISKYILDFLPKDYLKSRWGGEEFLFAANASLNEVYNEVENLRNTIANHIFICDNDEMSITITFGIAEYHNKADVYKAISIADERLYKGKKSKKNSTIISD